MDNLPGKLLLLLLLLLVLVLVLPVSSSYPLIVGMLF